jgi:hypothetical protein
MRWRKLGLVLRPREAEDWSRTHAMIPVPVLVDERTLRVYFSSCDADGRSRPGFVELDARDPTRVLRGPVGPLLDLGEPGAFDQDGVAACAVVRDGADWRLYYVGFETGTRARYRLLTGLAVSHDSGESFVRAQRTPVLERTDAERLFRCGPFVAPADAGYRMWYCAGSDWTRVGAKDLPTYQLRVSDSRDGISWPSEGQRSLELSDPDEHGFGRPWVVRDADRYRMFFSVRRRSFGAYRLAYAESADGITWQRGPLGLDVSETGWDSEAVMYSAVVDAGGRRLCFYNGNGFGRDGFGVAVLEDE